MRTIWCIFLLTVLSLTLSSQEKKNYDAARTDQPPVIDGKIEDIWKQAPKGGDFWMHEPTNHRDPSFETHFYVLYDDQALYIACFMQDPHPDSIMTELGERDKFDALNADHISVDVLPFNDGLNGNAFKVSAANLQGDEKYSPSGVDVNWDAVWQSATRITDSGWVAEMKIPWSELRFAEKPEQIWGFTIWRHIRRYREWDTWNDMDKNTNNIFAEYGTLSNIKNITPPLRLSLMPYFSSYADIHKGKTDFSYNGGMDLKYGINESFTLDMTLIPDFGQVMSDDIVLNLSPYEVRYDEKRQFFTEGTELFNKGNIFYSRRIGDTPRDRREVRNKLDSGETIVENPEKSQLINATKISGRTRNGLGIGFFNAMTSNTFAKVKDPRGETRKISTQPFTNYNMIVLDQNLSNNSYLALANTNTSIFDDGYSANVSGTDFNIKNKKQTYSLSGNVFISQKYRSLSLPEYGHKYNLNLNKEKGSFIFALRHKTFSDKFDPNDMGYLAKNNYRNNQLMLKHRIVNQRGNILNWNNTLTTTHEQLYNPSDFADLYFSLSSTGTFKNHLTMSFYGDWHPVEQQDYFEARVKLNKFNRPPSWNTGFWFSSDYRKRLAFDGGGEYFSASDWNTKRFMLRLEPRFRVNTQVFMTLGSKFERAFNERGFTDYIAPDILFGERNTQTVTNTFTFRYIMNVKHALNLRVRHYWASVNYHDHFYLKEDGDLAARQTQENYDINFNAFNVDLSYTWRFAPGSEVSLVWKSELLKQTDHIYKYYLQSLNEVFNTSQLNSLSVKIIYYLDYSSIKNKLS
ncbi:MAG: DUF5916 domain-containing protein [Bacteroidales bacterium]